MRNQTFWNTFAKIKQNNLLLNLIPDTGDSILGYKATSIHKESSTPTKRNKISSRQI